MELPEAFKEKMKNLMGEAYESLLDSYDQPESKGIRTNTLKLEPEELANKLPFKTQGVNWCREGFYIDHTVRPGKNPHYYAGLYYVQEPTAMAAVEVLDPKPGDWVLDLCAAPGGKSTQIGARLQGTGVLVANELVNTRAGILSTNIERMGLTNAIVTNEFPERLVDSFYQSFDKILVDAPCSGEGMFRKDPGALADWSLERVDRCMGKQEKILESAHRLLKPGGVLVYSTCTFSPEENEQMIEAFIEKYPYTLETIELPGIIDHGRVEWTHKQQQEIAKTLRIMPMTVKGEGHFIAKLIKSTVVTDTIEIKPGYAKSRLKKATRIELQDYNDFAKNNLAAEFSKAFEDRLYLLGEHLYAIPEGVVLERIANLKLLRTGLHLGTFKKNRFEPGYALAMALKLSQAKNVCDLTDEELAYQYLKGEALNLEATKGWVLVGYEGYSLGFGKASEGLIKNHYPKGLRIRKK
ncbi:RsmF rRNA methyltransferase first C-terminal domain-containing protein [Acetobacterium carbinolicum]|uniref:RsmF rRNA methyltransferase first C-terminal domain-containing protein n=1 Tax=Acetobacterium TaxID=33951 RepID=UPI000DBEB669|nr:MULTISPECIES: RsmF rRNA methyltransferase first C-terminal domain-containing protein [unclassified Acetobacterium]AWW26988.1 RNA methyltransferase [Acetobacterium sp. KB-1]MDZ5725613.1 RsmF rRNA methyltransferase first C-terminal domain-containing protein [Acetobacterium sp. K1/6]